MNKINFSSLLKEVEGKKKKLNSIKEIIRKIKEYLKDNEIEFSLYFFKDYLDITIWDPKNLTKVRKMLRTIFGDWKDVLTNITDYGKGAMLHYKSKDIDLKDLIVFCITYNDVKDLPKSITKNGKCGFKKHTYESKQWACETEVNND